MRWCFFRPSSTSTSPTGSSRDLAGSPRSPTSRRRTASPSPRRARRSRTTPGTCGSTTRASTASCSSRTSRASRCSASSTPASCGPTSSRSGAAGTGSIRAAHHQAVLRPLHPGDQRPRLPAAGRRSRQGAGLRASAGCSVGGAGSDRARTERRRPGDRPPLHMPYVEGFGTYPFGEEWLFDAFARSHLPVLDVAERLTMTITPVLADQLEADGVGERMLALPRAPPGRRGRPRRGRAGPRVRPAAEAEADTTRGR